ncbi:MAG: FecR domain-containing protein [Burkholderiales bacterium]|nr:FecR domain-containing protein [Burkholderiales bacterium]
MGAVPFARNRGALLVASVVAAFPALVRAEAARVEFAIGPVSAAAADGSTRTLTKGAVIEAGDLVNTGSGGRVQLRFTDGAFVSLQPDTQFRVDQYRFNGQQDGSERGFFSLLKGGLRTITGLVGRSNKKNYQVTTQVATIGIRGTEYTIQYGKSITGSVGEGEINVCNGGGCLGVGSGETYYVSASDIRPVLTDKMVDLPPQQPTPPAPLLFVKADDRLPDGDPAFLQPDDPLTSPSSESFTGHLAMAHNAVGSAGTDQGTLFSVDLTTSGSSRLASFDGYTTAGTLEDVGSSGDIGWGRFVNPNFSGSGNLAGQGPTAGQSFHYVFGIPGSTPSSGTANYTLAGGTAPTFNDSNGGNIQTGTLGTASMTADFGQHLVSLDFAVNAPGGYGGETLHASTSGSILSGRELSFNALSVNSTSTCFSAGCGGQASGFLAGANASRAGIAYELVLPGGDKAVGVFGLTQSSYTP